MGILVCWSCNKQFEATEIYFRSVVVNKISDRHIFCDPCGDSDEEFTYEDQLVVFWEEVWS